MTSAQLSPQATYEGQVVGRNIVKGRNELPDYRTVPSCVFIGPALASGGLAGKEAAAKGLKVQVSINDMRDWFSGETYGETVAWAKVLVEDGSGRIAGARIVGHSGEELIHLFSLALKHGIRVAELKGSIYAFPTFSSDVKRLM